MKKYSGFARWGPAAGVLAVAMMAFSLSLEGAAPSPQPSVMKNRSAGELPPVTEGTDATREVAPVKAIAPTRSGHATTSVNPVSTLEAGVKFGRAPVGGLPIMDTMTVDYRDDTGTRLRQAGKLIGPYRPHLTEGGIAAAGTCPPPPGGPCSFDIDCDDHDPCTSDVCDISVGDPLGSGTCINSALPNGAEGGCSDGLCCNGRETCQGGVCEAPGAGSGTFTPGTCDFPCSGGTVCNEDSNLCRVPCTGVGTCALTGGTCATTLDCPSQTGNYCLNCQDGVNCNGVETCVAGVCEAGVNPCGPGAICGERDCSGPGTTVCTSDADCAALDLGTCTRPGPICFPGRCCDTNLSPETGCTKRTKSSRTCSGGSNATGGCVTDAQCRVCTTGTRIGNPCTGVADCAGGTCGAAGTCTGGSPTCDAVGGKWYPTDDGQLPFTGGTVCPTPPQESPPNDRTLCPKYSSGVAPLVDFDIETAFTVGFFSQGPCDHSEIGDDYEFENSSPVAMEIFRWIGGGGGRLLIEFYDENGNFIEDVITGGVGGGNAVRSLNFLPPLTIPAKGYWSVSVATNFAPNGQTFVTVTDAVDEGINLASGPGSLWFNGAPSSMTLRECVGGSNDGAWCDPSDPGDSECVSVGGVCENRSNILAFEIEGLKVPSPSGACCNDLTGACTAGVLPWVCVGQGNNYQGNDTTCPGNCGLGACCATNGTCSVTTSAACTGGAQFQGFGTDCEPNCCLQPTVTGADNCQGVIVQNITVPDVGDPGVVRTISGNNAGATGPDTCLQGAWNAAGGTYLTVDPGWWEAFSIDDCAFVRVDFCCSDPVVEPQWALIWEGCPCDRARFTAVNPNVPDEPGNKRGSPYCEDDNLWNKFGPLPAGTYYVPVYSVPPGANAAYQMHITVDACPIAACCDGTTCVETDQLGCANIDGANFLAPPFRTTATTTCTLTTCNTGSCCYVPGQGLCQDVISGQLANETLCNDADGAYKGGARCAGCVCAAGSPAESCNEDSDCGTNGPCNNPQGGPCSGQNLTQPSPCPVCDFESASRCQRLPGNPLNARLSDECVGNCVSDPPETEFSSLGIRVADDFVADIGGTLNSVCVWGMFLQQGGIGLPDCSAGGPPEKFTVTIYNDLNGLPGSEVGSTATTIVRKAATGGLLAGRTVFQWQLSLNSTMNLTQGNTYWLEVVNNTDESSGHVDCDWFWALSDPSFADSGNGFVLQDAGDTYTFDDAVFDGADMAWCLNLDNSVPPIQQAACCTCGGGIGTCSVQTLENCTNSAGSWRSTEADCIDMATPCRNEADGPDNCADKQVVTTNSATPWNNYCTTTDGPASAGNSGCSAGLDYQNDLWYSWTAPETCDVVIETCDLGGEIDTGLLIYTDNTGTCPCPTSAANETACDDDGCVFSGAGSRITLPATAGVCYTIRVASFLGEKGSGVLHVGSCAIADDPPPTLVADPGFNKVRFISFSVPPHDTETALRVVLTSLHHVSRCEGGANHNLACTTNANCPGGFCHVPYSNGPSIPFTAFEGQAVWVGPPTQYLESSGSGIPFMASYTQCTPHYRDWNTVGLLHVTGSAIVPSSIYSVENVPASCQGGEGSGDCVIGGADVSDPLAITTNRWGDVTSAFNPPSTTTQPDLADIGSMVNKFRDAPGAPIKSRVTIATSSAFGVIAPATLTQDFNFSHVAACVSAFAGNPYPYRMGKCATGTGACTTGSDCTGSNAPPCNLFCP